MAARVLLVRPTPGLISSCPRRIRLLPSFRTYSSSNSRQRVELLAKEIESIYKKPEYDVDLLGTYRRGDQDILEATVLVVAKTDEQICSSPHAADKYHNEKAAGLISHLVAAGVLSQSEDPANVTMKGDPTLPVRIHYAAKASQGSAQLYLTGDDSFIRFLKIMAMEIGLVLTESGLWKPLGAKKGSTRYSNQAASDRGALPPGVAIQSMDGKVQESEGDRRMRETRKEMGLPEGLDLSLDLGSDTKSDPQDFTVHSIAAALAGQLEDKSQSFELIRGKSGSEHDIFDALGLVWLPPAMRFVKEPGSNKLKEETS